MCIAYVIFSYLGNANQGQNCVRQWVGMKGCRFATEIIYYLCNNLSWFLVMFSRDRIVSNIRLARRGAVFVLNLFITYAVICPGLVMQARDRIVSKIRLARRGAIL